MLSRHGRSRPTLPGPGLPGKGQGSSQWGSGRPEIACRSFEYPTSGTRYPGSALVERGRYVRSSARFRAVGVGETQI